MTPRKKHQSNHPQPRARPAPEPRPSPPAGGTDDTTPPDGGIDNGNNDTRRRHDAYQGQSEAHVHDDRELESERPRDDGMSERHPPGRVDIERT